MRPATADNLDDFVRLLHDEEVRRYLYDGTVLPRETVAGMLVRSDRLEARGLGLWVIEHLGERFAGIAGLQPVSVKAGAAQAVADGIEPVIALDPKHWGQGLAGNALNALILHARGVLGLSCLVATVDQPNARSRRLMQRCGFAAVGTTAGPANDLALYRLPLVGAEPRR